MSRPEKRQPDLTYHYVPGNPARSAETYRAARRLAYHTSEGYKLSRAVRRRWRTLQAPLTYVPPKRLLFARERRELVNVLSH